MYSSAAHRTTTASATFASGSGSAPEVALFSSKKFPFKLSFYQQSPLDEVTLEQFEEWALDRLRVLSDVETAGVRNMKGEEMHKFLAERVKKWMPLGSDDKTTELERKKDQYSHFILRLAFCRSEELRVRFLRAEVTLFKVRWEMSTASERRAFVQSLNFGWEVVLPDEKAALSKSLMAASYYGPGEFENESFFKVHWTKVADLVHQRKVFLEFGQAYVPSSQELSLVVAEFTARLTRNLELTAKALPRLDEDDRLLPILSHLSSGFSDGIASEYTAAAGDGQEITAQMVPALADSSFPFCMRSMQEALKSSHHLKHEGRQQLGLFLKAIGMPVTEALIFWRKSFSLMTDDKFKKDYAYNVRHSYGLEGSRKTYGPRSCQQIITGKSPSQGESHGCPFAHYTEANLTTTLSSTYKLTTSDSKEILGAVKSKHYHVACTRLFEIQHAHVGVVRGAGIGGGDSVDHPNKYFDESRKLYREKKEEEVKNKEGKMEVD